MVKYHIPLSKPFLSELYTRTNKFICADLAQTYRRLIAGFQLTNLLLQCVITYKIFIYIKNHTFLGDEKLFDKRIIRIIKRPALQKFIELVRYLYR